MSSEVFGSLLSFLAIVVRIAITVYLYQTAKAKGYPQPAWWILFGIFQPVPALMLLYVLNYLKSNFFQQES